MPSMEEHILRWKPFTYWDPWPLIRLLSVLFTLGLWAHWRLGWTPPALPAFSRSALGVFEAFCLCALVSFSLTRVFLAVLMFPLFATIVLNDWFYDCSHWLLRIVAGPRSPWLSSGLALGGELGLFLSLAYLIERLLRLIG